MMKKIKVLQWGLSPTKNCYYVHYHDKSKNNTYFRFFKSRDFSKWVLENNVTLENITRADQNQ